MLETNNLNKISAGPAQYLNFFVLILQSFQKIPAWKALAPPQKEPPFAITQLFFPIRFVLPGVVAMKFHVGRSAPFSIAA
jgi:hypothetical protein